MTATTIERLTSEFYTTFPREPIAYDVEASTNILYGTVVALNELGNVVPVTTSATSPNLLKVLGIAQETVRNSGVAGAAKVLVHWGLVALENGESIDKTDFENVAYIGDNQTAFKTSDGGKRAVGGVIKGLTQEGRVWVQFNPGFVASNPDNSGRWIDLYPTPFTEGAASASLTVQEVRNTGFRAPFFRHDQDDSVSYRYQMPHNWVLGSEVRPHLHFRPHGTTGGVIVIDGYYTWSYLGYGQALPQLSGWTTFRQTKTILDSEMFYELSISLPSIVPPSWAGRSAHLQIFFRRPGFSDSADTFTSSNPTGTGQANLELVSFDAHVLIDGFGSVYEFGVPE